MSTAATTPRLGLMSPANSDDFDPDDFVETMGILDGTPGIKPVTDYSSLPSDLGEAQHGSCYLQLDNQAMWMWDQPDSSPGSWTRINSVGLIASAQQTLQVETMDWNENAGITALTASFVVPGGRDLMAFFSHPSVSNAAAYGASRMTLWIDNVIYERSYAFSGKANVGVSHHMWQRLSGTPGQTRTVKITLSSVAAANAGQSSATANGVLLVWEL